MNNMNLEELAQECIEIYQKTLKTSIPITRPSIPILYFGNKPAYDKSEIKIISVGLNPSHNEFPVHDKFKYFRKVKDLTIGLKLSQQDVKLFLESLNDYYKGASYRWFNCFEPMLNGMNASYYENKNPNRVLHTDICSPIATDITWSDLDQIHQQRLSIDGIEIWHRLVKILAPDFIILSLARKHLQKIRFDRTPWKEIIVIRKKRDETNRTKPYPIIKSKYKLNGKTGYLIFGQAAQTPFGKISNTQKRKIGQILLTL